MFCSYHCTSCIFIVYLFYPPPALVCCCIHNSNELLYKKNILLMSLHFGHPAVFLRDASAHPLFPRLYGGIISSTVVKPKALGPQCCLHYSWFTFPWWPFEPRPGVAVGRMAPEQHARTLHGCYDRSSLLFTVLLLRPEGPGASHPVSGLTRTYCSYSNQPPAL